jgi:transcription initiation factor IIE alpha subunit
MVIFTDWRHTVVTGMTHQHHCSDCDSAMEKTNITAEGVGELYIETERDGGVLDRLGIGYQTPIHAFVCPECGATQLYADISE